MRNTKVSRSRSSRKSRTRCSRLLDAGAGAGAASAAPAVPKGLDPAMVQQKLMHVVEQAGLILSLPEVT